ncbi:MAG: hypothetical protein BWY63_01734 [Chloroflexi bacterium ADurb.Bin360]|nr:MAG: hypothetical protein BWY63_01734 [Chloroflexi bacterium ADurb.Bin360]
MEKRFGVLRFIATLWKILAWVVLVLGLLGAIATLVGGLAGGFLDTAMLRQLGLPSDLGGTFFGVAGFLGILIGSVLQFFGLYAVGEIITVFLSIEENTRATRLWIEHSLRSSQPMM